MDRFGQQTPTKIKTKKKKEKKIPGLLDVDLVRPCVENKQVREKYRPTEISGEKKQKNKKKTAYVLYITEYKDFKRFFAPFSESLTLHSPPLNHFYHLIILLYPKQLFKLIVVKT